MNIARLLSGIFFFCGNLGLLVFNALLGDYNGALPGLFLTGSSIFMMLSARKEYFLCGTAICVASGYAIIAITADGDGRIMQWLAALIPFLMASLVFNAGYKNGNPDAKGFFLVPGFMKRYPLAMGSIIATPPNILMVFGAALSEKWVLLICAILWMIATLLQMVSDTAFTRMIRQHLAK